MGGEVPEGGDDSEGRGVVGTTTGPLVIDEEASTKLEVILGWQYFFDLYVERLVTDVELDSDRHICAFQWRLEQPFKTVDERFALTVVQNCPTDIIEKINFVLTFPDHTDKVLLVDNHSALSDILDNTSIDFDVFAKTQSDTQDDTVADTDFGVWLENTDTTFSWTYLYTVFLNSSLSQ